MGRPATRSAPEGASEPPEPQPVTSAAVPRSRNKYSRARMRERSRKSRHQRTSGWFYATVAVIIVVGVAIISAIVISRDDDNVAPIVGDHWHAAFGVNIGAIGFGGFGEVRLVNVNGDGGDSRFVMATLGLRL